jgi:prepilin-type N-terminal cleavage/methylation domain-containing protein
VSRVVRAAQRGFTLIELMISLLISTLLVILILSIFSRMSFAFREQQKVASVQQVLSAAHGAFDFDAKQAGMQMSNGFTVAFDYNAGAVVRRSPVRVVNNASGPDEVGFYYASPEKQALVTVSGIPTTLTVDAHTFVDDELVVLSTPDTTTLVNPVVATDAKLTTFNACVLQVDSSTATTITFAQTGDYGRANNDHCQNAVANKSMIYKFVGHYWRIDRSTSLRKGLGVLQLDPTGALAGVVAANFQDQAYGVVDLQFATFFYDGDGTDTQDPDVGDGNRDWQSGENQETYTNPVATTTGVFFAPMMLSVSLVARTNSNVEGVYTANYPNLTVATNLANNTIGDRATFALPDASDPAFTGFRIYRHITFQVDLRNMGIGR